MPAATEETVTLTREEARRIAVGAALLDARRPADVVEVAEQVATIKIDPTAVIAPCEQSMLWSRIGWGYEPGQLAKAVEDGLLFEHDGTFRPVSLLPAMLPGMRAYPTDARARAWLEANDRFRRDVLRRLRAEGPLRAGEIPDTAQVAASSESGWYGPSQVPRMLELLARRGDVAVARREGRQRVWDLAERVLPLDAPAMPAEDAARELERRRLQAAGIARRKGAWTRVGEAGVAARIEGSATAWRVDPDALAGLADDPGGRCAILNPYDGMLFDRPRLREIFDFEYVLEQFKPKHQRVYGYFTHPILVGDRFVGLLDAAVDRDEGVLRVANVHELAELEDEEHDMIRRELADLAGWLGVRLAGEYAEA